VKTLSFFHYITGKLPLHRKSPEMFQRHNHNVVAIPNFADHRRDGTVSEEGRCEA
jgi:hypothetical protein